MLLQIAPVGNHRPAELALDLFVLLPYGADALMLDHGIPGGETLPTVATVVADLVVVGAPFLLMLLPVGFFDPLSTVRAELPLHDARGRLLGDFLLLAGCDLLLGGSFGLH